VNGDILGSVTAVHDFGAGTILEVNAKTGKTVLVPFTKDVVPVVDLSANRIEIDPPEGLFGPMAQQTASEGNG
jgi:16S rRNA processing protein RimM